jgi:CubicO group peptidase (beta-lactamase class C family)
MSSRGGYLARLRAVATRYLRPTTDHPGHPSYPGAVVFASIGGRVVAHFAVGDAVRYRADHNVLPTAMRVAATLDTMYDLASLTKLFTAALVMQLVEAGQVSLDDPVETHLPDFASKPAVTVRMLLTHTSGLTSDVAVVGEGRAERLANVLREPVRAVPGTRYVYADKNFIALGALVERLAGQRLDAVVRRQITEPQGMRDTMFRPPRNRWARVAATTGARRGEVHDPVAAALNGIAGHAGLFSTAYDVSLFGHALIDGHTLGLSPATVDLMRTDQNSHLGPAARHGLGVDLDQSWYMGRLARPSAEPSNPGAPGHAVACEPTFGHTGFTGTSLVVEPVRRVVLALLANRVHPDPKWGGMNPARRAAADVLAD